MSSGISYSYIGVILPCAEVKLRPISMARPIWYLTSLLTASHISSMSFSFYTLTWFSMRLYMQLLRREVPRSSEASPIRSSRTWFEMSFACSSSSSHTSRVVLVATSVYKSCVLIHLNVVAVVSMASCSKLLTTS